MTFWEFFNSHFWWCILILALSVNESTWLVGIIISFILVLNDGTCPTYIMIPLGILACFLYVFTLRSFWKVHYQHQIKHLKYKVWKLRKEITRLKNGEGA